MSESSTAYDLFIAHAATDREWVRGYLMPKLGLAPERMLTPDDFQPGAAVLDEFVRAITTSQFTVLVLTPAFTSDAWTTFSEQISSYSSVAEGRNRLIPLLLQVTELPLQLDARVQLNYTDRAQWDTETAQLRQLLQQPEPQLQPVPCPYPGMIAFTEAQADVFFGRDAEIKRMLQHLRQQTFLFVIGPSGSGKSSLVFAGLLPQLAHGSLFAPGFWRVIAFRPGAHPLAALGSVLGPPEQLAQTVTTLLASPPIAQRLLIVVDQFEENFTLASGDEQKQFTAALQTLRLLPNSTLVITMRADFYGDLMGAALWPIDDSQRLEVLPLRGNALRQALTEPAAQVGVYLEPELVECLADDADNQPGALPLVQETMQLLWAEMEGRLLTIDAYQRLGKDGRNGLAVAVATKADATLATLTPEQKVIARHIFLRLIQFGEGRPPTRRQQALGKLEGSNGPAVEVVVNRLVQQRMLTLSADPTLGQQVADVARRSVRVDLAHEVLIEGWPTLQSWLAADQVDELTRRRLETAAADWASNGHDESYLLRGPRLREAQQWSNQHADQVDAGVPPFLSASVQATARQGRTRLALIAGAVVVLVLIAGIVPVQRLIAARNVAQMRVQAMALNPLVALSAGSMVFGTDAPKFDDGERPTQMTTVAAFALEAHEVTNRQFGLCVQVNVCQDARADQTVWTDPQQAQLPVTDVSTAQATAYCQWLGRRLPTEVEWERAARGLGTSPVTANVGTATYMPDALHTVEQSPAGATPEGIHDLIGNVWEWTSTVYQQCGKNVCTAPWNGKDNEFLIARGGSWQGQLDRVTQIRRTAPEPDEGIGFRCAQ